jgi:ATP-binding cassette subfamily F protein 3
MLTINNLSKSFAGREVLKSITYNFPLKGIIALVGSNGAGKTTFLNILCSLEEQDSGQISKAKDYSIGYLPQEPCDDPKESILQECMSGHTALYALTAKFNALSFELGQNYSDELFEEFEATELNYRNSGGYSFEHEASKILLDLGFKQEVLEEDPKNLSGGWRMRLELAKLLLRDPDFLILDEPTNHLDLPTIMWLEAYLKKFKGAVLFVSHDEWLLNSMPDVILHLKNGNLNQYMGNYNSFLEQYQMRQAAKVASVKNLSGKIESAARFVERFGAKASKATQAASRVKMIARMQEEVDDIEIDKEDSQISFQLPLKTKSGKDVAIFKDCALGYNKPLLKKLEINITRGQRIAVVGANGLGKSTLLKTIVAQIPLLSGEISLGHNVKIGYYAQNQAEYLNLDLCVLDNLKNVDPYNIGDGSARSVLGSFLFKGNDVYKVTKILSGGEKSRLSLACLLMQDANFLLLDEPTNHLDMLSTQMLSYVLAQYEGTVLFVSHNRSFINSIATHILAFSSKGHAYLSKGNLDELDPKHIA